MADIHVRYQGGDRLAVHVGGHELLVDQPVEAGGEDLGPTPTELFVAGLAACVGFYAERYLRRHDLPVAGLVVETDFEMSETLPARVSSLTVAVRVPESVPPERRRALERVIEHCTVHNSLREPPAVRLRLVEQGVAA